MPIRIWNQPGGPVQWGEDLGMAPEDSEEWKMLRGLRTPSGHMVDPERGQTLNMMGPYPRAGNISAIDRIMSRQSPFKGVSPERYQEAMALADEGLSPDEMTARRLSRPRFETNTLKVGDIEYPMTEMVEPSRGDLSRSAEYWKMAGQPLAMRMGEAEVEKDLASATRERALAESYLREPQERGPDSAVAKALFDSMVKSLENDMEFQMLPYDQKMSYLMKKYQELFGVPLEAERPGKPNIRRPIGAGVAPGPEDAVDELFR